MYVKRIHLENFGPFQGRHSIELDTGLSTIIGENGAGKSLLLAAIPYALYGSVPGTTAEQLVCDAGGPMRVGLCLSDGTEVTRGWDGAGFVQMSGAEDARAPDAVKAWVERSGLTAEDFRSTVYLGMGDVGSLITAGPAARRDQMGRWVVPSIWATLETKAAQRLSEYDKRAAELHAQIRAIGEVDVAGLERELVDARRERRILEKTSATPDEIRASEQEMIRARRISTLRATLRHLHDTCPQPPNGPTQETAEHVAQRAKLVRWEDGLAKIRRLAKGDFPGPCPVDGVECPRAREIREDIERHKDRERSGAAKVKALAESVWAADKKLERTQAKMQECDAWWTDYEATVSELENTPDVDVMMLRKGRGQRADFGAIDRRIGSLQNQIHSAKRKMGQSATLRRELGRVHKDVIAWQWMAEACGRDGVPSMLFDSAIHTIVDEGNAILESAGVPLRFEFRLRRERKKLADRCQCGEPFAPRIKKCKSCGAKRQRQMDHDCLPIVSGIGGSARAWRSSGQEAMLAVGLRLGAAAWRKRSIACPWSTIIMDEIEGPLSDENAQSIRDVIRGASTLGFAQQLMVSHRASSRLSGQRLIRVVRDGDCSRIIVD